MIIFLYGENSYLSKEQLDKIKKKHLANNLNTADQIILYAKDTSYSEIIRQISTLPFLSKSRLVIIKNLLIEGKKDLQEKILAYLKKVPSTTILVFYENKSPDKRTKVFKDFKKNIEKQSKNNNFKLKEFNSLDEFMLKTWVEKKIISHNKKIDKDASEKLLIYVGNDLWRLSNEIDKLLLFVSHNNTINSQMIDLLVRPKINSNIFALVDAVVANNISSALSELYCLRKNSVNEFIIFKMIYNQFKNLLMAKELVNENANKFTIQKYLKIHPFVAQKIFFASKKFNLNQLKDIFDKICDYDFMIKSGRIEAQLGIEVMVIEICLNKNLSVQLAP